MLLKVLSCNTTVSFHDTTDVIAEDEYGQHVTSQRKLANQELGEQPIKSHHRVLVGSALTAELAARLVPGSSSLGIQCIGKRVM